MVRQKEEQILKILKSQGIVARRQIGSSDQDEALETAYHEYCKHLHEIGFTEDLIPPKARILEILRSQGAVGSSQSGDRNAEDDTNTEDDTNIEDDTSIEDDTNGEDEGQLGCSLFITSGYLLTCKQIMTLVQRLCLHLGRVLSFG